jgi:hypothetical protein
MQFVANRLPLPEIFEKESQEDLAHRTNRIKVGRENGQAGVARFSFNEPSG